MCIKFKKYYLFFVYKFVKKLLTNCHQLFINYENSHNAGKEKDGNSSTERELTDGNQNNSLNNDVGAYSI